MYKSAYNASYTHGDKYFLEDFQNIVLNSSDEHLRDFLTNIDLRKQESLERSVHLFLMRWDVTVSLGTCQKSLERALALQHIANERRTAQNYRETLVFLNRALMNHPICPKFHNFDPTAAVIYTSEDLAKLYASRSEVLYKLKHFEDSLADADVAHMCGYPSYLVFVRKVKCLTLLGRHEEAKGFTQKLVDYCQKIGDFSELYAINDFFNRISNSIRTKGNHKLLKVHNINPLWVSKRGRYYVKRRVRPGTVIGKEKPMLSVANPMFRGMFCSVCLRHIPRLFPCPSCSEVMFCSAECFLNGMNTFHGWECRLGWCLNNVKGLCRYLLALRSVTTRTVEQLALEREVLINKCPDLCRYPRPAGADRTEVLKCFCVAVFLTRLLGRVEYHSDSQVVLVASTLFRAILETTRHKTPITHDCNGNSARPHAVKLSGAALYPTVTDIYHACAPNCRLIFEGTEAHLVSLRDIDPDECLTLDFSDTHLGTSAAVRKAILSSEFGVECGCRFCTVDNCSETSSNIMSVQNTVYVLEHAQDSSSRSRVIWHSLSGKCLMEPEEREGDVGEPPIHYFHHNESFIQDRVFMHHANKLMKYRTCLFATSIANDKL